MLTRVSRFKKIFLFNAPPRAGKDTYCNMLVQRNTWFSELKKFAAPIKRAACAIYCNNDWALFCSFDTPEMKDVKHKQFLGKSCREVQISISEDWMKKFHGDRVFGEILANDIHLSQNEMFFVSDSGFRDEALVLAEEFKPKNVIYFRIMRMGYTFKGDSRSYIDLQDVLPPENMFVIHNPEGEQEFMYSEIKSRVENFIPKA